ncbi:MAG: DUF309 domain-containing protein [Halobacteriaceae archaeon]
MESHLKAGIAIYNDGYYHAAHDAWEEYWLSLESGSNDEKFLHGLIQFTAAVHHGYNQNWEGTKGLAESSRDYLADLPESYRNVNVEDIRQYLRTLASDPEYIERTKPLKISFKENKLQPIDLSADSIFIAAEVFAEEFDYDSAIIDQAIEFAKSDLSNNNESSVFISLLFDFVCEPEQRSLVFQRLTEHVHERKYRENDVKGLFDASEE